MLNTHGMPRLSPLERTCLELIQLTKRLRKVEPDSKQGIVLLRKISELRSRVAAQLPQNEGKAAPPVSSWRDATLEGQFIRAARSHNLEVLIPMGPPLPFHVIVMTKQRKYKHARVLVRPAEMESAGHGDRLIVNIARNNPAPYKKGDFDTVAAVAPDGIWHIIPFAALRARKIIPLPRSPRSKKGSGRKSVARYRDRWDLFK